MSRSENFRGGLRNSPMRAAEDRWLLTEPDLIDMLAWREEDEVSLGYDLWLDYSHPPRQRSLTARQDRVRLRTNFRMCK